MKCYCVKRKIIIDYDEYSSCICCGSGYCLTLDFVGASNKSEFLTKMCQLLNRNREDKLKRILK